MRNGHHVLQVLVETQAISGAPILLSTRTALTSLAGKTKAHRWRGRYLDSEGCLHRISGKHNALPSLRTATMIDRAIVAKLSFRAGHKIMRR